MQLHIIALSASKKYLRSTYWQRVFDIHWIFNFHSSQKIISFLKSWPPYLVLGDCGPGDLGPGAPIAKWFHRFAFRADAKLQRCAKMSNQMCGLPEQIQSPPEWAPVSPTLVKLEGGNSGPGAQITVMVLPGGNLGPGDSGPKAQIAAMVLTGGDWGPGDLGPSSAIGA